MSRAASGWAAFLSGWSLAGLMLYFGYNIIWAVICVLVGLLMMDYEPDGRDKP